MVFDRCQLTAINFRWWRVEKEEANLSGLSLPDRFSMIDSGPYRRWPSYLWQQTQALRRSQADWYVSTFLLPPIVPCRAAVLVHDLSFRAHPDYFPRSIAIYMRVLVGLAMRRADVIVALSEFTRREIERFYPWALRKTAVVYPGIDRAFDATDDGNDEAARQVYGVKQPYILAVGNIHPRKNLARMLAAYERVREKRADIPVMVWAGVERWGSDELRARAQAAGVQLNSVGCAMRICLRSIAAHKYWSIHRYTKALACRPWKRWPAVRR